MTIPSTASIEPSASPPEGDATRRRGRHLPGLSPRLTFLRRRVIRVLVSLALVVVATFLIVHIVPGDPVRAALGPSATPTLVAHARAELGLDKPELQQFADYVTGLFHGHLGLSLQTQRSVGTTLGDRLPVTLTLAGVAFAVAALLCVPIGMLTAVAVYRRRRRWLGNTVQWLLGAFIAMPDMLLGVGLIALFGITLHALPVAGWGTFAQLVLPVVALAIGPMSYLARIVHVEMLSVLETPFMTTARGKRLPAHLRYLRHALPNIITGALTAGGLVLTGLVAGTVIIETVFAIPGLGTTIVTSITAKDYPMIQGVVLLYASLVLGLNLVIDLILTALDPHSSLLEG
ncbi:ABC transporter permease [Amycolatopsis sp. GM8]|uniref:ABC transporter permease n=1 Tax=Amycolatopsis sp. GM8 TaxID=2896530 RepID=UPI001F340FE8|nr:ABC transporter permease [Amycolatopsis sp. GM8]